MSKTRALCFIGSSEHLETIKAPRLRRRAFVCFLIFGTSDETLALVFDMLRIHLKRGLWTKDRCDPRSCMDNLFFFHL